MLIVFDLDGTLVDSRQDLVDSANEMLASYGAPALEADVIARMIGDGARVLVERTLAAAGLLRPAQEALDRFLAVYDRHLVHHTRPYPGVPDALAGIGRRASLAVLTNKPERPTRRLLDAFDLTQYFGAIVGGDAAFPRKPDPAGLRHLMTRAGVDGARTLMVGDSMVDVRTARGAGTRVCVALYGFGVGRDEGLSLDGDELLVRRPENLAEAIEQFLGGNLELGT